MTKDLANNIHLREDSHGSHSRIIRRVCMAFATVAVAIILSSCFTGIEGTKKITLSKEDLKLAEVSEEELLLAGVVGVPASEWKAGKRFIVADAKASLLIEGRNPEAESHGLSKGDTLIYIKSRTPVGPDGRTRESVVFGLNDALFEFTSGKVGRSGVIMSDALPGLIDADMIDQSARILNGREMWTLSRIWEDAESGRIDGLKYAKVKVVETLPGDMVFPLKVRFVDDSGREGNMLLNFGNSGKESHSFANMFLLSDPRKKYPSISDTAWDNICRGRAEIGMTKDEVRLAKGNPSDVNTGHDYSKVLLLWTYPDGNVYYFEDGILTGINSFGRSQN